MTDSLEQTEVREGASGPILDLRRLLREMRPRALGLTVVAEASWITLEVHSSLEAVGLTAAVARVLTEVGIPCNMVAALHHDHLFVPVERGQDALAALKRLTAP